MAANSRKDKKNRSYDELLCLVEEINKRKEKLFKPNKDEEEEDNDGGPKIEENAATKEEKRAWREQENEAWMEIFEAVKAKEYYFSLDPNETDISTIKMKLKRDNYHKLQQSVIKDIQKTHGRIAQNKLNNQVCEIMRYRNITINWEVPAQNKTQNCDRKRHANDSNTADDSKMSKTLEQKESGKSVTNRMKRERSVIETESKHKPKMVAKQNTNPSRTTNTNEKMAKSEDGPIPIKSISSGVVTSLSNIGVSQNASSSYEPPSDSDFDKLGLIDGLAESNERTKELEDLHLSLKNYKLAIECDLPYMVTMPLFGTFQNEAAKSIMAKQKSVGSIQKHASDMYPILTAEWNNAHKTIMTFPANMQPIQPKNLVQNAKAVQQVPLESNVISAKQKDVIDEVQYFLHQNAGRIPPSVESSVNQIQGNPQTSNSVQGSGVKGVPSNPDSVEVTGFGQQDKNTDPTGNTGN